MSNHYIITIHNSDHILERTLSGVEAAAGPNSSIIPVLDGCTDASERIAMRFKAKSKHDVRIAYANNIHEIGAINAGLNIAPPGGIFILQDDVVLKTELIENILDEKFTKKNENVGYVSFRMGGAVCGSSLLKCLWHRLITRGKVVGRMLSCRIDVASCFDTHGIRSKAILSNGESREVTAGIKSPVWISSALREKEPYLDEDLMPFCLDDVDMSLRALRRNFKNFVISVPYESDARWGGTRKAASEFERLAADVSNRNRQLLYQKHAKWLKGVAKLEVDGLRQSLARRLS